MNLERSPIAARLLLVAVAFFAVAAVAPGDVFDHSGTNGTLTDGLWLNQTKSPPNVYGSPGPADDAYFYGATITASGGSVHLLSGGNLSLSGALTAVNAGELNSLSGSGTLTIQAVVMDAAGYEGVMVVGGHLVATNGANVDGASNGGTVKDTICNGPCGGYDTGSSLTITGLGGPGGAAFSGASKLTANGGLTGFSLGMHTGSTGTVSTMTNSSAAIDGSGTLLTVTGAVSLNSQALTVGTGAVVNVNGNLTEAQGAPVYVSGTNSSLTVGGDMTVAGAPSVSDGGALTVQGDLIQHLGDISLDGGKSSITVQQQCSLMAAFLDISNKASLTVNGQLILDGGKDFDGNDVGGGGGWTGASTINTSDSMFVGNISPGGFSLGISGATVLKTGNALIGAEAGAIGTVFMSDIGTLWEVQSGGLVIGQSGTANFYINSGAHLLFDSGTSFAVGLASGSHGTLTMDTSVVDATGAVTAIGEMAGSSGIMNLTDSDFTTAGDFTVGDFGSGSFTFMGSSSVSIDGAATKFLVGNNAGSAGSVSGDGSLMVAGPVTIGGSGYGFLGSDGGVLAFASPEGATVGAVAGSSGSLVLGPSSSFTFSGPLLLGDAGTATLELDSNAKLTLPASGVVNLTLGSKKGSSGTMTVTSSGSFTDAEPMIIGSSGHGIFDANLESTVSVEGFVAPNASGGQATITVDSSNWTNTGNIYLGNTVATDPASTLVMKDDATMRVNQRMTIFQSGTVTIDNTSMMAVGTGAFGPAGSLRVSTGGILGGYGRVQGQVIVGAGGQIYPGNSPGIFNVTGAYTQEAGSTYSAEIGGTTAGTGFDQVNATGAVTLGGTLKVRLVNGFTPAVGQTFQLVKGASVTGAFGIVSQPSQAGIALSTNATGLTATITSVVSGAPVISSPTTVTIAPGTAFTYQITATNTPTSYGATDLPAGLTVNHTTGLISGTPTKAGAYIVPINANNAAGSGQADLTLVVDPVFNTAGLPPANLLNISTRLNVLTNENVLIGGFIVTGTEAKKVLLRGIGPSLGAAGVSGALADPVLELHEPDGTVVTDDNWMDTQKTEIEATGIPPINPLESAIIATLAPNNYTVILHGKGTATGVGLIEAYDLDQAAASTLANISTRGFVDTGDSVMIGGFIVGGAGGGNSTVIVRAIGPSLSAAGITNPLQDPTLELHDADGALISSNDNWMDSPDKQVLIDDSIAPTNAAESAIVATLAPGNYTAVVQGSQGGTGVALVEAYNLH